MSKRGENVDVFRSLKKNLYEALDKKNIPDSGIAAPSAWMATDLKSTAVPYFDGEFRGNYNDELKFEVEYYGNKSEFYIQQEQYWTSETVENYADIDIDIDLILKSDQTTPEITIKNYNISAASYSANGTVLIDSIVNQINSDFFSPAAWSSGL